MKLQPNENHNNHRNNNNIIIMRYILLLIILINNIANDCVCVCVQNMQSKVKK